VRELRPGLWHWQAPHPEWEPDALWPEQVSSYAIDDGERLLIFDPQELPSELEELAGRRETVVVLTSPWHERSAQSLVERLSTPVYTPKPDEGSPDVAWLQDPRFYSADGGAPEGIQAFAGREENDVVLWIESHNTVLSGDTLADFGRGGLEIPPEWVSEERPREQVVESLRPLLERPVEQVLPTHGSPTDRAALERALG
jgi:glyoxylase-like metal-dependent hydrolase (beta-lactamase superfamily II)